jgi:C-terminal processing protease CtpA/Prc
VIAGGGAAAAGLEAGAAILAVDGQPATTLGFDGAIQLIRGPGGTAVRLLAPRPGAVPGKMQVPRRRIRR